MTYAGWERRYRVTTMAPGKLDLFVVTFIDGLRTTIDPITDYDAVLARANAFHGGRQCQIKVLPMTGPEIGNLLGIKRADRPEPIDADVREQFIGTLTQIARDSNDGDARADALKLLADMGVLQS
jgi:hypothetical protein